MGNIIPANALIGRSHDTSTCQHQHPNGDGCNISNTGPDYQGENFHVDEKTSPPNVSRHHMRIFRLGGQMFVISSIDPAWNESRGRFEERGRSAIFRAGRWIPITNKKKEPLKNHDEVALLWNRDRGAYMSFTFYTQ
jgi:hypothetical protein